MFAFPNGKAPADGDCPEGTTLAFDASNPTKKIQFEQLYSGLVAADRTFWSNLRQKVVAATTVADLGAPSPLLTTLSTLSTKRVADFQEVRWAPPAAPATIQRGRVGGFSIAVKP